jgi:hypothetical protein
MSEQIAGEEWDPDRVGMNVMTYGEPWDRGGPDVMHSPWWIRAHWGRAFEILRLEPGEQGAHGLVVMRKRAVALTREDLERQSLKSHAKRPPFATRSPSCSRRARSFVATHTTCASRPRGTVRCGRS